MHLVLAGRIWESVIVYLDDINVMGKTFDQTLSNIEIVLKRFRKFGLKLKPRKCTLFCTEIKFLGRKIVANGVHVTADHIQTVLDWPKPKNRKELESFLGFVNYHREYMCGLAEMSSVLYQLTGANSEWVWGKQHTEAFKLLKNAVTELPVMGFPTHVTSLSWILMRRMLQSELSWVRFRRAGSEPSLSLVNLWIKLSDPICTKRKELLAVVVFTNHFRHYLLGQAFMIRTDHASLVCLMSFKQIGGQLSHWLETLSQFTYTIELCSGKKHCNTDGLFRIPERATCDCYIAGQDLNSLPCGGCTVCTEMHDQWKRFERDVDDVLPLAIHHVQREEFNPLGEGSSVARSKQAGWDKRGFHLLGEGPSSSASSLGSSEIERNFISDTEFGPAVGLDSESADGTPLLSEGRQVGVSSGDLSGSNFMEQYSKGELREMQLKDVDLSPVIRWLETSQNPSQAELQLQSPATWHYWTFRDRLHLKNDVLYYLWDFSTEQCSLMVAPKSLRKELICLFHNAQTAGHLGRDKTLEQLEGDSGGMGCLWMSGYTSRRSDPYGPECLW